MGCLSCKECRKKSSNNVNVKKVTLLVLGLDNAGKSSVIRRITKTSLDDVLPTVGFAVYDVQYKGCNVTLYDVGGGPKIRGIWKQYYADVHGIIFVVDASDPSRIEECRRVLRAVLAHEKMTKKPLLLLANKQDKPNALDEIDVVDKLQLEALVNQQKCPTLVELCAAVVNPEKREPGIKNGVKWLLRNITKDYPALNNRVLVDIIQQEEAETEARDVRRRKLEQARSQNAIETCLVEMANGIQHGGFKTISHANGKMPKVDLPTIEVLHTEDEDDVVFVESQFTRSEQFFRSQDWSSTAELLNEMPSRKLMDVFKRPKSSGALELPIKKKKKRKRRLMKNNKTVPQNFPLPQPSGPIPAIFDPSYTTEVIELQSSVGKSNGVKTVVHSNGDGVKHLSEEEITLNVNNLEPPGFHQNLPTIIDATTTPRPRSKGSASRTQKYDRLALQVTLSVQTTLVGMIQKRSTAMPARSGNVQHSSARKSTHIVPVYRADTFKIEPLLRRDAPSLELTAQMQLNQLYEGRISRDIEKYFRYVKCRQVSANCANFTLGEVNRNGSKWWTKPDCPAYPPNLLPPREINHRRTVRLSHLDGKAPGVQPGGSWAPPTCLSHHSVAIVIPYRDRWRHLTTLMNNLHPLLQRQLVRYKIFVVEQRGNETFNKGIVMNAAFLEALHEELFHCVIFHDVDLLPETDYNMYTCPQMPRHLSVAVNELHYRLPYYVLVGGVLAMRTEHFFKVNGFSNLYWGWGGEDDDMGMRIQQAGLQIIRPLPSIGRYTMIKHVKRSGIEHRVRSKLVRTAKRRYRLDGLNTVQYRVVSKTENPWFTTLLVDVGTPPPSLQSNKPNA